MVETSRIQSLRVVASLINSGGDLATVLQRLVLAACRHANWSMGSIMAVDVEHGYALVVVRHDPTLIQRPLPDRWELATSPSLVALRRNEPVFIPEPEVEKHQVEILFLDPLEGRFAVFGGFHIMALPFQGEGSGEANRLFVVYDENIHERGAFT